MQCFNLVKELVITLIILKLDPLRMLLYTMEVEYSQMPATLSSGNTVTFLSQKFPTGLLYACLVEAYGFLKGPMEMLTYYEQRYKQEVDKFGLEQIGRRRRGDYTSGTIRIPMNTPSTTDSGPSQIGDYYGNNK